jgi:hypothetical protein
MTTSENELLRRIETLERRAQHTQSALTLTSPGNTQASVMLVAADPKSIVQADVLRGHLESQKEKK